MTILNDLVEGLLTVLLTFILVVVVLLALIPCDWVKSVWNFNKGKNK